MLLRGLHHGAWFVLQPQTFGDPLFMRISDGETLSEFKPRVQALLGVSDDEFARWKFCFNTSLRPTGKQARVACPGTTWVAGTVLHVLARLKSHGSRLCEALHGMQLPTLQLIKVSFGHADYLRDEEVLSDRFPAKAIAKYPCTSDQPFLGLEHRETHRHRQIQRRWVPLVLTCVPVLAHGWTYFQDLSSSAAGTSSLMNARLGSTTSQNRCESCLLQLNMISLLKVELEG